MGRIAQQTPGLEAARDQRAIEKWLCELTGLGVAYAVLTDAAIFYNIPEGKQVIITRICYGLRTANDTGGIYLVGCDAVDGGGNASQQGHCYTWRTGAAVEGREQASEELTPPLCLKYSDGHRSISIAAKANDVNAVIMVAWHGWYEDEKTLD